MEREILLSGIGGQGVQLCAKTLANAAVACGLEAMVFGTYGGSMRGGRTSATVVLGDEPLRTPPDVDSAWAGIVLHPDHWAEVGDRLRPGGIAAIDSDVCSQESTTNEIEVLQVAATSQAIDLGSARMASMVILGAFAAATNIVDITSLREAAMDALPTYRSHLATSNSLALQHGWDLIQQPITAAWPSRLVGDSNGN